jgi:iron(III) transport system permease protein
MRLARPTSRIGTTIVVVAIIGLGTFLIYPIILLLILSFNVAQEVVVGAPVWGFGNWIHAWQTSGLLQSLGNSVILWFFVTVIGLPIGVAISLLLARTDVRHSRKLEVGFWIAYIFPLLSAALGWQMLLSPNWGFLNKALEWIPGVGANGPFNVYSFPGLVFVKLMVGGIAFYVILLTPAFRNMNTALEQAGRVSGASSFRTMIRVTLPVMSAPIALAFALHAIDVFSGFEIEYLIGTKFKFYVFSTYIYQLVREDNPPQYATAVVLASVTMLVIAAIIPFQRWITGRRNYTTVTDSYVPGVFSLGRWRRPVFVILLVLIVAITGLPTVTLVVGSFMTRVGFFNVTQVWTLDHWQTVLSDPQFLSALGTTVIIGIAAGVLGPIIFSILAYIIVRTNWRFRAILDTIIWTSSALPGILIGLGLLLVFLRTPGLNLLFGTIWPLIIVLTLRGATTGTNMFKGVLVQLGGVMEEAGRVSGAGWMRTFVRIVLPILAPSMVLVGMINFVAAASATSAVILLASYDTTTLSILGLQLATGGQLEEGGIVSLVIMALSLAIALPARAWGNRIGLKQEMRMGADALPAAEPGKVPSTMRPGEPVPGSTTAVPVPVPTQSS